MTQDYVTYGLMLAITLVASVTDFRTGLIPNKLTFPALLLGPVISTITGGTHGLVMSLLGLLVAGTVPILFHRLGAMGGGDVKLFAALGGLGGPRLGLEIEMLALTCAFLWGILKLAYHGQLLRSLGNSGRVFVNLFLPAKHQRPIQQEQLTTLRIGSAIFAGTLLAVINHWVFGGSLA